MQQCSQSKPGNIIISPFSVAMQLSLIAQATNGRTFDELRMGLHFNGDKEVIANQFHRHWQLVQKSAGDSELLVANQIYLQQELHLKKAFQEVAAKKFSADVETVNFFNVNDTVQLINNFVAVKTKDQIKEIITPEDLYGGSDTVAVLINAVYLKSSWANPFYPLKNHFLNFSISETETVKVEYMTKMTDQWHTVVAELDAAALRLDYANSNFSFIIILPNNQFGLDAETQFSHSNLSIIINQMEFKDCHILIPKFKVESEFRVEDMLRNV